MWPRPRLRRFRALYDEGVSIDAPPDKDDGEVPGVERAAVTNVAAQLKLRDLAPEEALRAVATFFAKNFSYTTWQEPRRRRTNETALAEFLLKTRAGHCEHFATARQCCCGPRACRRATPSVIRCRKRRVTNGSSVSGTRTPGVWRG